MNDVPPGVRIEDVEPSFGRDQAPVHSEEAIALTFVARHTGALRYVAKWGKWFVWDGCCWREDVIRKVFSWSRLVCREVALTINKGKARQIIASAKTRAAIVSLASDDPRLAATIDQWDRDPWLLNTPKGVVDLRTGQMREHQIAD
jgi:putative DNA primase/helicase